ncbi:MAG TPA: DUF3775 domain-containing protein [Azospirillum sp.]
MQNATTIERPELNIGLDKIAFIIAKAREFDVTVTPSTMEDGSDADNEGDTAPMGDDVRDPTLDELEGALDALNDDEIVGVIALAWLGRGDFTREDWEDGLALARERHNDRSAEYLTGIPNLADCLEEGLEQLGFSCMDVEQDRP